MNKCKICNSEFELKNPSKPAKTCSKQCKNELARQITIDQFSDPAAREVQRQKSLEQKQTTDYQTKFKSSINTRTARWKENGHPRKGMQ